MRQPSWQHLTRWSSMLDSHRRVNSSRLRWSPMAQSTGMLFSSWASWAASDWWRRPGMFEHLCFYSNVFRMWCNVLIRFCCTMVLSMTTGQSRVHYQTNFIISVFFVPSGFFPWSKNNNAVTVLGTFTHTTPRTKCSCSSLVFSSHDLYY